MPRFVKTRLSVVSAVLFLLGLYAIAGLAYSAWIGSADAAVTWAIVAGGAWLGAVAYQRLVARGRKSSP